MEAFASKVLHKRWLSENTFVLRLERHGMGFRTGQYIVVGIGSDSREYSIYSGEQDAYLEILVRRVDNGTISRKLSLLEEGSSVSVEGPYGFFVPNPEEVQEKNVVLVATGTGIAPFRSFVRSLPGFNYHILHGTRYSSEAYEHNAYDSGRLTFCTTREKGTDFHGRVTDYFRMYMKPDQQSIYYLCGNSAMIEEMADYLEEHDIDPFDIRSEAFF